MWLSAYLILAITIVTIAGWALQRFRPSTFARYPGGIEEFRQRSKFIVPIYFAAALMIGAFNSGIPFLVVSAAAFFTLGVPILTVVGVVQLNHRSRWGKRGKVRPSAETQEARIMREAATRQQLWQQQLNSLPFPYDLVPGAEAETAYEAARVKGQIDGFTPLIITPASLQLPNLPLDRLKPKVRQAIASAPPAQEFFSERIARWSRYDEDGTRQRWLTEAPTFATVSIEPAHDLVDSMFTLRDATGHRPPLPYVAEAALVRIPTPRSWEIPAYTLYGGWNDCPETAQIVAVARHWSEKYGADICAFGDGTIEFRVDRPPADLHAALDLVREHMLFCDEGANDLIASPEFFRDTLLRLPKQKYWLFWWD
jgi:hypothetical protein